MSQLLIMLGFTGEMILAIGLYAFFQGKRKWFPLRLVACLVVSAAICLATSEVMVWGWLGLCVTLIYLWTLVALRICFELTWLEALVCWIAACATQFISAQSFFLLAALFHWGGNQLLLQGLILVVVYTVAGLTFGRQLRSEHIESFTDWRILRLSLVVWLAIDLACNYGRQGQDWQTPLSSLFSILCALFLLMFEFSFLKENRAQREKRMVEHILAREAAQHRIAREVIDCINIKSHDLKYQLEYLRHHGVGSHDYGDFRETQEQINRYDDIAITENEALSVVLTEKNLYCRRHDIKLLAIADGEAVAFMDAQDIYSLFNNLIDNAIECLCQEPDMEKRMIDLNISRKHAMVSITCANYCGHPVEFRDDLPVTTKEDRTQHGYGVKSIRYLVKKYGGNVVFRLENHRFEAFIWIPWMEK